MKAIIFTALKIIEVCTVVFMPHYIVRLACYLGMPKENAPYWLIGTLFIVVGCAVSIVGVILVWANLHLTKHIYKSLKSYFKK